MRGEWHSECDGEIEQWGALVTPSNSLVVKSCEWVVKPM